MERLRADLDRFLKTGQGDFDSLALELFRRQFELNKPYQAFCRTQGIVPEGIKRWQDIPAVPVQAFKSAELATFPIGQAAAEFRSSATTTGVPSRHYLKTLGYYETSLKTSFDKWMIKGIGRTLLLILTPSPAEAPRSSLSWMMEVVKRTWGAPGSQYFIRNGRLDELWLSTMVNKAEATGSSVALLGTTIAFLSFFEYCARAGKRFVLPSGSHLMDTGGMKTQKREVTRSEFVQQAWDYLRLPEDQCINEYGMCEMSSQFYGIGNSAKLEGPPWVKTLVIDPTSGQEAAAGQPGILRHFDLANVDSVMAIQTEDVGRWTSDGFELLGRAPQADLKGCSLSAEAFLK